MELSTDLAISSVIRLTNITSWEKGSLYTKWITGPFGKLNSINIQVSPMFLKLSFNWIWTVFYKYSFKVPMAIVVIRVEKNH